MLQYSKADKIILKNTPEFNEAWLRDIIADDPAILGLGDLSMRQIERPQAYGRLDLLLRDDETNTRYEVEIQLGSVDESHIIRTIEYWDEERTRYPQYDHIAVIIAEDITARFFNVINLFNKAIPIIAIQLNALKIDEKVILNFTRVLDLVTLPDDEDEAKEEPTDRSYWQRKALDLTLEILDGCFSILQSLNSAYSVNYTKRYVGIKENNKANNALIFWPKKAFLRLGTKNADRNKWLDLLEEAGITVFRERKSDRVHLRLVKKDIEMHSDLLRKLFADAYNTSTESE
jgi:hypothetical protein